MIYETIPACCLMEKGEINARCDSLYILQIIDCLCIPGNRDAALKLLEKEGVLPKNMMTHVTE
jgi:hypothetical protein